MTLSKEEMRKYQQTRREKLKEPSTECSECLKKDLEIKALREKISSLKKQIVVPSVIKTKDEAKAAVQKFGSSFSSSRPAHHVTCRCLLCRGD
jgi:SMC interacting uncharacterized protein involved in chromosome segregation